MSNFYFRLNATECMNGSYSVGNSVGCLACPAGHKCPTTDVSVLVISLSEACIDETTYKPTPLGSFIVYSIFVGNSVTHD